MLLKEKYPNLEREFDKELNNEVNFHQLTIGSRRKIWWRCSKEADHIWLASINQRTSGKKLRGCPVCAGKKVVKSNSLATTHPDIANQWHQEKNSPLTSHRDTAGSNKKVWWKCCNEPTHSWVASPKQRTQNKNNCPICNSLGYLFPILTKEWHPIKNGRLTPFDVSYSSHQKVWWKCPKGFDHIWQASPNLRTSMKTGCPICAGYKVVKGNSLATMYPEIAAQWFYERNGSFTPGEVYFKSHQKVWWKCKEGDDHFWKAEIRTRVNGIGCPICSGRKAVRSNSLGVKKPNIAALWHPTKNGNLSPFDLTPLSNKMAWWKCPEGEDHEWKAIVANVVNGTTCPVCMNRKITETNNICALFPTLKNEWDFEANKGIDPYKVSAGSKIKVWWNCKRDTEHKWYASIKDRTYKDSGCPFCEIKFNVSETKMYEIIKDIFQTIEVKYRFKPKWLKRMELDVYIPKFRLGFEYQGHQHFRPIELFGGEKTYFEQVKRDKLKKEICEKRGVNLIYVYYDEKLSVNLIKAKIEDLGLKVRYNSSEYE
jgi:hypothetical protein